MKTLALLLFLVPSAFAQSSTATSINSFVGIEFSKPLPPAQECPKDIIGNKTHYNPWAATTLCWELLGASGNYFQFHNVIPGKHDQYPVLGGLHDGDVDDALLWFSSYEAELFLSSLTAKYGLPTKTSDESVATRSNAQLTRHIAVWTFQNLEITYQSISDDIRRGNIHAYTLGYKAREKDMQEKNSKVLKDTF